MPNRIVREGILDSERIEMLTDAEENFYRRIMSIVDDYGRFEIDPVVIRGRCYVRRIDKISTDQVLAWIKRCADVGLLNIYSNGRKKYLEVVDFKQPLRSKSKFPDPSESICFQLKSSEIICKQMLRCTETDTETNTVTDSETKVLPSPKEKAAPVPIDGRSPQTGGVSQQTVSKAAFVADFVDRLLILHPKKVDRLGAIKAAGELYDTLASEGKDARGVFKDTIEFNHAGWCRTTVWTEKNGNFSPRLSEWLGSPDRAWRYWPHGVSKPMPKYIPSWEQEGSEWLKEQQELGLRV